MRGGRAPGTGLAPGPGWCRGSGLRDTHPEIQTRTSFVSHNNLIFMGWTLIIVMEDSENIQYVRNCNQMSISSIFNVIIACLRKIDTV